MIHKLNFKFTSKFRNTHVNYKKILVTAVRMAIGWQFLYEGLLKLLSTGWSAETYLSNAQGFLAPFYQWLASSPQLLAVTNFLNIAGLLFVGMTLAFGMLSRAGAACGVALLTLYYFAYPPFGAAQLLGDSNVYVVNQILIEIFVLLFLCLYKERGYGMDEFMDIFSQYRERKKKRETAKAVSDEQHDATLHDRRQMLKDLAILPVVGALGWSSFKRSALAAPDAMSGATTQATQIKLGDLHGTLPKGKLGPHKISRLIMGGNLMDGTAHARDLLYVSQLFKHYNTENKIFETLMLAEETGINCVSCSDWVVDSGMLQRYRRQTGSKIKIHDYYIFEEDRAKNEEGIKRKIDQGVDILQVHGTIGDRMVMNQRVDVIGELIDIIRRQGVIAGLGAHDVHAFIECEKQGIIPDFYMKTMHHDHYWSAHPRENRHEFEMSEPTETRMKADHNLWHDNLFDTFPDLTVEFINRAKVPVIGFKVLAGGAIDPKEGFKYAFENGADFICVGMFDFQIVDDVNTCIDTLKNLTGRKRAWFA